MEKVRILIVEDEYIIAESIGSQLENLGYEVAGIHIRAELALQAILEDPPDFAILDIQLKGEKTGIWLGEQIQLQQPIPFIFLTSHGDEKTVQQAIKAKPLGYLNKPFEKHDLYTSIEVALANFEKQTAPKNNGNPSNCFLFRDNLFLKDEYVFVKIPLQDILFIKSDGNYLEVHTGKKRYLIKSPMKDFLGKFPSSIFQQTHRSYALNLEKIDRFGSNFAMVGDKEIPLSSKYRDELFQKMGMHS